LPIRQRAGAGRPGTAEQDVQRPQRERRKRRKLLVLDLESKVIGVERDGPAHIRRLIPDAVKSLNERRDR